MIPVKASIASRIPLSLKHSYLLILLLWIVLTAININKAFHIDDTFHLEASAWIQDNPGRPMSGFINWKNDPTPIYSHNQPPLFFFIIALFSSLFGTGELPLHLLISIFTFLSLLYFNKITRLLSIQHSALLLVLFAFCPAFIVNQNLMTDVPILALILASVYYLLKAGRSRKSLNYCLTATMIGLGLLIKYSVLPLLIVLILVIIIRREYKFLLVLLIPVSFLLLWSSWNYLEFGSIHFLDRPKAGIHINRFWSFFACIGSVSTFTISFVYGSFQSRIVRRMIIPALSVLLISLILVLLELIPEQFYTALLNLVFIVNGFLIFITLYRIISDEYKLQGFKEYITSDSFILLLYLGSISAFVVLFAPFIATRHILLVIPFVLLPGDKLFGMAGVSINRLSAISGIILGLLLGISDWKFADYYRDMASSVDLPEKSIVWTAGHWGWQWYSEKNGMKQYSTNQSDVHVGDYFVYPADIAKQEFEEKITLTIVEKKWQEAGLLSFFSGNNVASMYSSSMKNPPWCISKSPIDTIYICRISALKADTIHTNNRKQ